MTNKNMLLLTSALVAFAAYGGLAHAQSTTADVAQSTTVDVAQSTASTAAQAAAQSDSTQVSDVIVTVNKRNEKIEDVPVAVTAYTPEQRDLLGVVSIFDFTRAVPSFEYSTTLDRSFIRGVGRNTNAPGTQAGVAVYVDGVYTSSTYGLDRAPILSGTFEADAGPQGTLFGRNSIGGVLQQTSAHATDHFETNVDLRYNDHNRFDEAATIGGPINGNENFKLLVGADIRNQKDGYFNNLATGKDEGGPTSERLYFGIFDFKWGNVADGFFKLESSGFNRKLSGFSQYGSSPTEVNPLFNDTTTGSTALNLNQFTNCTPLLPQLASGATDTATVQLNIKNGGGFQLPPATPGGVGLYVGGTNPTGYVPGTYQAVSNSYTKAGYRSLQGGCLTNQPGATTYYDPTNPAATNPFNFRRDFATFAKSHDNWDTALQNTFHLGAVDLKYIGGYNQYVYDNRQDGDSTARGAFVYDPDGSAGNAQLIAAGVPTNNALAAGGFTAGLAGVTNLPTVTIDPIVAQYYENRHWYSHEFDFSNADKSRLNWIVGLFYYNDLFHNISDSYSTGQTELATTTGAINPNHNYYDLDYLAATQSKAIYGQLDYAITDKLKLTLGYRWNRDDVQTTENDHYFQFIPSAASYNQLTGKYVTSDVTNLFGLGATCNPASVAPIDGTKGAHCSVNINPAAGLNERFISDAWTGYGNTANLSYQPNEDTLMYVKYSRGYKAGGIVQSSMNASPVFGPETLNDYEAGYKFNPSRTLTVNLAGYYYDYRNYQDFGSIPNAQSRTGFSTVGFNIPKSRNYGAELTSYWHPIHALNVTLTGDYLNAKVVDGGGIYLPDVLDPTASGTVSLINNLNGKVSTSTYTAQPCGPKTNSTTLISGATGLPLVNQSQCITGDSLKGASPWKIFLNVSYQVDFDKGSLTPSVTFSDRAGNVSTYSKDPAYKAPSYNSTDVRMIWEGAGKKYQLIGFVANVFNQVGTEYQTASIDTSAPAGSQGSVFLNKQLTIPRTWGIELQAKF